MRNWWQTRWRLPRPEKACCCIPLRKGIIVFTYYNLVIVIAALLGFVVEDHFKWFIRVFTMSRDETQLKMARIKMSVVSYLAVYLGGILAEVVMVVVNLVGLHRKRLKLVKAYLFYSTVFTILIVVLRLTDFHSYMWMFELTVLTIFLSFKLYFLILIRSQVKKMEEREQDKDENKGEVELEAVDEAEYEWNETFSMDDENPDEWKLPKSGLREEKTYLIDDDIPEDR